MRMTVIHVSGFIDELTVPGYEEFALFSYDKYLFKLSTKC